MPTKTRSVSIKHVLLLLTPSAMSSVFTVVASLAIALGAVFINRYKSSSLSLEYKYYQAHKTISSTHLTGTFLQNKYIENLPFIFFWIIVGVIVYIVATDGIRATKSAVELGEELNYVHVQRKTLVRDAVIRLGIRVIVLAVWLPYLITFFHHIVSYAARVALLSSSASSSVSVAGYIILSVLVSSIAIHVNVILVRLLFLKPRLFSVLPD